MRYYIITGASRGIGAGIARAVMQPDNVIFALARHENSQLKQAAAEAGTQLYFFPVDLADSPAIEPALDHIFQHIDLQQAEGIYLVNNAGVLQPIGPLETHTLEEDEFHLRVNLLAPMRLTAGFIRRTNGVAARKVVATISSGAAQRAYFGWSSYCSGKAGVEMFTRVAGLEQQDAEFPIIIYAIAPGIVDTDMQVQIRRADDAQFRDRPKFLRYHEKGYLASPEETGRRLAATLDDPAIQPGDVLDIRDLDK